MLNRELQESMNLPPFINTAGGLGEPLPGRRGEDEEMRMGERGNGGEGKRKRKGMRGNGVCRRQSAAAGIRIHCRWDTIYFVRWGRGHIFLVGIQILSGGAVFDGCVRRGV